MAPFYGRGITVSSLQSHFEETVGFLPLSSQDFLVTFNQPQKGERVSQPPIGFELGTSRLGI